MKAFIGMVFGIIVMVIVCCVVGVICCRRRGGFRGSVTRQGYNQPSATASTVLPPADITFPGQPHFEYIRFPNTILARLAEVPLLFLLVLIGSCLCVMHDLHNSQSQPFVSGEPTCKTWLRPAKINILFLICARIYFKA